MSNQRVLTYRLPRKHPDKVVFTKQSIESRRLYNSLNAIAREAHAYYRNKDADTHISKQLGLLDWTYSTPYLNSYGSYEKVRKKVELLQDITLPQKVAQHVARNLASNWTSYYGLLKGGHKAKPPRFKQEYSTVHYTIQTLSKRQLRNRIILPTGWGTGVRLPDYIDPAQVQAARLTYKNGSHWLEVIYKKEDNPPAVVDGLTAAIDLGVNNLATVVFSDGRTPLIINGRPIKSVNQYANKRAASIRSQLDKEKNFVYSKMRKQYGDTIERPFPIKSSRLDNLWGKRNRKVNHYLHSASSQLITKLVNAGVKEVLIGWNPGFKQQVNMGKKNNQTFTGLPLVRFITMLEYKGLEYGIKVRRVEESYTSKASFLDNDHIPTYGEKVSKTSFSGKRIKRGLYRSSNGMILNADVNAAYNILVKNATFKMSNQERRGCVVQPVKLPVNSGWLSKSLVS